MKKSKELKSRIRRELIESLENCKKNPDLIKPIAVHDFILDGFDIIINRYDLEWSIRDEYKALDYIKEYLKDLFEEIKSCPDEFFEEVDGEKAIDSAIYLASALSRRTAWQMLVSLSMFHDKRGAPLNEELINQIGKELKEFKSEV